MKRIAIIGAGIAGLTAASKLNNYADVTIFEKARGVSGRMSTRWADNYYFDHGAQFFKAQTPEFKEFITPMINEGVISPWNAHFVEFKNREIINTQQWDENNPHYVGVPGMNAIAKYLSQNLHINLGVCVLSVKKVNNRWHLENDKGEKLGEYDFLISTVPAEQAAKLLPTTLPFFESIDAVKMQGCYSLMLGFKENLQFEFDAARVHGEDVSWISVNNSKPARGGACSILVHSTNGWADEHIDDDRDEVMNYLCDQTSQIIGHNLNDADHKAIHGWRFATAEKQHDGTHFYDEYENIAVCGDWCIQGKVEAAFTSGFEAANQILNSLNLEKKDV